MSSDSNCSQFQPFVAAEPPPVADFTRFIPYDYKRNISAGSTVLRNNLR